MKKKISKTRISSIILFLLAYAIIITGSTYAYMSIDATNSIATGEGGCFQVSYTGQNINAENILSTINYAEGAHTTVTLSKDASCKIYTEANIYIHTNNTTTAPIDTHPALKYKIITDNNTEYEGIISEFCDQLLATVPLTDNSKTYNIYLWIDSDLSLGAYNDTTYSGYIYAEANQTSTVGKENTVLVSNSSTCSSGVTKANYSYTGNVQTFIAPEDGFYQLETWGAQGGSYGNSPKSSNEIIEGGYGSYSKGNIYLSKNEQLYIYVGGQGQTSSTSQVAGGYNGGGYGTGGLCSSSNRYGSSGGGATHIAKSEGLLSTMANKTNDIIIVSGGGGGSVYLAYTDGTDYGAYGSGGHAGGYVGNTATFTNVTHTNTLYAEGGNQENGGLGGNSYSTTRSESGSFGQGGNRITQACSEGSGGGGGYYGGGAGGFAPGGGGSGYIGNSNLTDKVMYCNGCETSNAASTKTITTQCANETPTPNCTKKGNGYVQISLVTRAETKLKYTGTIQEYTVPKTGIYKFEVWGAQGGGATFLSNSYPGGKGGYAKGNISLNKDEKIYIYVGGEGESSSANNSTGTSNRQTGYNGGGKAGIWVSNGSSGGGGGATDIRMNNYYEYTSIRNNGTVYYGPYWRTGTGHYQVDIYGSNLTNCSYRAYDNNNHGTSGNTIIEYTIYGKTGNSNHMVLYVNVDTAANSTGLEVRIDTIAKCTVTKEVFSKLEDRIIIAGGGGGAKSHISHPDYSGTGGFGGGATGGSGTSVTAICYNLGQGGTQNAAGGHQECSENGREYGIGNDITPLDAGFGLGANYNTTCNTEYCSYAGGGGGYYGGSAGYHAPGGGGSGYIGGVTNGQNISVNSQMPTHDGSGTMTGNSGNGYAKITLVE